MVTVPQTALLLRDGFAFVFKLEGSKGATGEGGGWADARVTASRFVTGSRRKQVVAQGVGFLADGDTVRVAQ